MSDASVAPDGRIVATYSAGRMYLWDGDTGDILRAPLATGSKELWFSSDGRRIVSLRGERILVEKNVGALAEWPLPSFPLSAAEAGPLLQFLTNHVIDDQKGIVPVDLNRFRKDFAAQRRAWLTWKGRKDDEAMQPAAYEIRRGSGEVELPGGVIGIIGKEATVECKIASSGGAVHLYLNSKADYKNVDNFAVHVVNGIKRKKEFGLEGDVVGRTVRATGIVEANPAGGFMVRVEQPARLSLLPVRDRP